MIKDILFVLIVLSIASYAHSNKSEIIDYMYEVEATEAETASV